MLLLEPVGEDVQLRIVVGTPQAILEPHAIFQTPLRPRTIAGTDPILFKVEDHLNIATVTPL